MSGRGISKMLIVLPLVLIIICGNLTTNKALAQAIPGDEITYLEFIIDSSLSMRKSITKGQSRMQVAKNVLEELVTELPDQDNLFVALRIYGAGLVEEPCKDSVLVQPFGPIGQVRNSIIKHVQALEPNGMTPIGYSLELAGQDFPKDPQARKIIVLITDGAESCGRKPCEISKQLQKEGLILEPYVVGFDISARESSSLACIGKYYAASDTASLKQSLQAIMQEVIAPTMVQVQAIAGGKNVTHQVTFKLLDQAQRLIVQEQGTGIQLSLMTTPGSYIVQGTLDLGEQTLTRTAPVALKEGETTSLVLDFGELKGQLELVAKAGNQDVTGKVTVRVTQGGRELPVTWQGTPKLATLETGFYDVTVCLPNQPISAQTKTVWVPADGQGRLSFNLGELATTLRVKGLYVKEDITHLLTFTVMRDDRKEMVLPHSEQGATSQIAPGTIDLVARFDGLFPAEKTVSGIVLQPGETQEIAVDLSDVLGRLRLTVLLGEMDVTATAQAAVTQKSKKELPYREPHRTALLPVGTYLVDASTAASLGDNTQEVLIKGGRDNDLTIKLVEPGRIEVQAFLGTQLASPKELEVMVYQGQIKVGQMYAKGDRLILSVPPGVYELEGHYLATATQEQKVKDVVVDSGKTTTVKLSFAGEGLVALAVTLNEQRYIPLYVWVYQQGDYFAYLEATPQGTMEGSLPEGTYDLCIVGQEKDNLGEAWVRDVQVLPGQTKQVDFSFGGLSKMRLNVTLDEKPYDPQVVWVYQDGNYYAFLELARPGLLEAELPTGTYDLWIIGQDMDNLGEAWIRDVQVLAGQTTQVDFSFGNISKLRLYLTLDGEPYDPSVVWVYQEGDYYAFLELAGPGRLEAELPTGTYDLCILGADEDNIGEQWIYDVQIESGKTSEVRHSLGEGALLEVRLTLGGRPYDPSIIELFQDGDYYADFDQIRPGLYQTRVLQGSYELLVGPNDDELDGDEWRNIEVKASKVKIDWDF